MKNESSGDIPQNYEDLKVQYGVYVATLVTRYNKVQRNTEELLSYVWVQLVVADIINRFQTHVAVQMPKTMTAVQACEFLSIKFNQWRTAMWAFHKGDPIIKGGRVVGRRQGHWMPTPINLAEFEAKGQAGYSAKTALFDFDDIFRLSHEERVLKSGRTVPMFSKQGPIMLPKNKATEMHFKAYLSRAIRNHILNWCRTQRRKHQERAYDTFTQFAAFGREDASQSWESSLEDPHGARQDAIVEVEEMTTKLSAKLREVLVGVPTCKPVEEHEAEMYDLLKDGYTLSDALRKMDLPKNAQKAMLRMVAVAREMRA